MPLKHKITLQWLSFPQIYLPLLFFTPLTSWWVFPGMVISGSSFLGHIFFRVGSHVVSCSAAQCPSILAATQWIPLLPGSALLQQFPTLHFTNVWKTECVNKISTTAFSFRVSIDCDNLLRQIDDLMLSWNTRSKQRDQRIEQKLTLSRLEFFQLSEGICLVQAYLFCQVHKGYTR